MLHGIALALAIASVDVPSAAEVADALWNEWAATIEEQGWTHIGDSNRSIVFVRAAPQYGQHKRTWVRYEIWGDNDESDADDGSSMVALSEVDCSQGRTRTLQLVGYSENNLRGGDRSINYDQPTWSFAVPGSMEAAVVERTCGLQGK
ncbi:surface-adhesin E family protein [Caulobacter sp. 17J80-11]|uniref:surface-adhesin E family protein n=1 Tax=Caulobacter sp. 17J80-11 TaxID=2763502 RepID=UPI00351C9A0C